MAEFGEAGFTRLVAAFYRRVREDDIVGVLYPPDDWEGAEWRLRAFLCQRFGLSTEYSEKRGHPRLRMRHMPFAIGPAERDRWLELMSAAMDETEVPANVRATLTPFFVQVAEHMRNQD
ncbi:MAG: globin [Planctomycetota bacterium]